MNEELASALLQEYKDTIDVLKEELEFFMHESTLLDQYQDHDKQAKIRNKYWAISG